MITLVTLLFVLTAILLIGIVLIQQPKVSGGLFAGTGQSLLGTSGKTFWTKFTTILAAVFMGLSLLLAILSRYQQPDNVITGAIEKQQQQTAAQPPPSQAAPAPAVPAAAAPKAESKPVPQSAPAASQPATKK